MLAAHSMTDQGAIFVDLCLPISACMSFLDAISHWGALESLNESPFSLSFSLLLPLSLGLFIFLSCSLSLSEIIP